MLLNPSHSLTYSGLPPDMLDAYGRYKTGTRAIIAWLCQKASLPLRRYDRISIRDLTDLASAVCHRAPVLPESIDFQFRETISARQYLSQRFRLSEHDISGTTDTKNHEFFTAR